MGATPHHASPSGKKIKSASNHADWCFKIQSVLLIYWRSYFWRSGFTYIFLFGISISTSDLHLLHLICACPFRFPSFLEHCGHRTSSRISTVSFLRFYWFPLASASVVCFLWNLGYFIYFVMAFSANFAFVTINHRFPADLLYTHIFVCL